MKAIFDFFKSPIFTKAWQALLILLAGFILVKIITRISKSYLRKKIDNQKLFIFQKISVYVIVIITLILALKNLGVDLSILLGAAGVLTIALGFASQTSASNLIAGILLMIEEPFSVGDIIRVNQTTGYVLTIDLLSTRLRTFDNLMVRLPNDSLMKSQITNLTHFPIRRVDLKISIPFKEDLNSVHSIFVKFAEKNPLCLDEPAPAFMVKGFEESTISIQFSVWAKKENFLKLKNTFYTEISEAFADSRIKIPLPQRIIHTSTDSPSTEHSSD